MDKLSEQQRLLIAVGLSVGILLVYQAFFAPPPVKKPIKTPATTESTENTGETAVADAPTVSPKAQPDAVTSMGGKSGAADAVARVEPSTRSFETEVLQGRFSNIDGRLQTLELKDYSEPAKEGEEARRPVNLVAAEGEAASRQAFLTVTLEGAKAPELDFASAEGLNLSGRNASAVVRVDVEPVGYTLRYRFTVQNPSASPLSGETSITMGLQQTGGGRSMFAPAADVVSGLCYYDGGVDRDLVSALVDESVEAKSEVRWAGIDRQYFVVAAVPTGEGELECAMSAKEDTAQVVLKMPFEGLASGGTWEREVVVFAGPKRDDALEAVSPILTEAIEYNLWGIPLGAIARPMVWMLNLFHGWTGNWGFAIILLTFVVKTALFPVTYRSAVSMRKMQQLRPEIDKLKKQYENDRERQQLEQMKLFREQGVNPLGGCLP
ncbi:MAG: membrane protein insertase YidC, partial [Myxococcota bacterium]